MISDTKFKWLVSAASVTIIAVTAIVCLSPEKRQSESRSKLGDYVYVDRSRTLHIDRKCKRLNYKGMTSERIPVDRIDITDIEFCPNCVDDEAYTKLSSTMK